MPATPVKPNGQARPAISKPSAPHVVRISDPKSQMLALSYHAASENLTVIFRNSPKPYIHTHVPAEVFDAFRAWHAAGYSPGKFYHTHIKPYPLKTT